MPMPNVWQGTLCMLGESDKAYRVCSADAVTTDLKKQLEEMKKGIWIPKSITSKVEKFRPHDLPLFWQITLTIPAWFVDKNPILEDWLEEIEPDDVEDSYDRFKR